MAKRDDCIFADVYSCRSADGATVPVCSRKPYDLLDAIHKREHCFTCPFYINRDGVVATQDANSKIHKLILELGCSSLEAGLMIAKYVAAHPKLLEDVKVD